MPMTTKERNELSDAKIEMLRFWNLMCEHDGINPSSKFVIFSPNNPHQRLHGEAVGAFMKLRNRVNRNVARRERHTAVKDFGLTRAIGSLGGVY